MGNFHFFREITKTITIFTQFFSTEAVEPAEHGSPGTESPGKFKKKK